MLWTQEQGQSKCSISPCFFQSFGSLLPSPAEGIGQDITLAKSIRSKKLWFTQDNGLFLSLHKSPSWYWALICEIINSPGCSAALPRVGAACVHGQEAPHHFHSPVHGKREDWEREEHPFPLTAQPGSCVYHFCSHLVDHSHGCT